MTLDRLSAVAAAFLVGFAVLAVLDGGGEGVAGSIAATELERADEQIPDDDVVRVETTAVLPASIPTPSVGNRSDADGSRASSTLPPTAASSGPLDDVSTRPTMATTRRSAALDIPAECVGGSGVGTVDPMLIDVNGNLKNLLAIRLVEASRQVVSHRGLTFGHVRRYLAPELDRADLKTVSDRCRESDDGGVSLVCHLRPLLDRLAELEPMSDLDGNRFLRPDEWTDVNAVLDQIVQMCDGPGSADAPLTSESLLAARSDLIREPIRPVADDGFDEGGQADPQEPARSLLFTYEDAMENAAFADAEPGSFEITELDLAVLDCDVLGEIRAVLDDFEYAQVATLSEFSFCTESATDPSPRGESET